MVIDYKNKEQMKELNFKMHTEHGRVLVSVDDDYEGVTFRNFPTITAEDVNFKNCTFEDTQAIEFSQGEVKKCTFRNISEIRGHYADFKKCTFVECCSQGPLLTIDSSGSVTGCSFETITALGEDGYVIYSVYGKKDDVQDIKNCRFIDCTVESEDKSLTYCAYFKRFSSFKTKEIDNVDFWSCDFGEGVPVLIGSFDAEVEDDDE